jgi:hypothetical protein
MFTPAAPSAGPTGGAGFAEPAASASLIILDTFFAITGSACLVPLTGRTALRLASALAPASKLVVWPTQENSTAHERRVLQSAMSAIGAGGELATDLPCPGEEARKGIIQRTHSMKRLLYLLLTL